MMSEINSSSVMIASFLTLIEILIGFQFPECFLSAVPVSVYGGAFKRLVLFTVN